MNNNIIVEMKHTDIRTVDKSKLVDISTIKINPSDSPESRVYDNKKFLIGADCDKVIDSSIEHTLRMSSIFE